MKIARRDPVEFIKYMLLFIKWNSDSPVGNADGYCSPCLSAGNRQFGFLFRVLHSIIYQVTDDVAEMRTVCNNNKRFRLNVQFDMYRLVRF